MTPRTIAHHKYNKQSETCLISNEMQLRLQEFPAFVFEAFVLLFVVFGIVLYGCWVFSHLLSAMILSTIQMLCPAIVLLEL